MDFLEKLLFEEEVGYRVRTMSYVFAELMLMNSELANRTPSQLAASIILVTYEALGLVNSDIINRSSVY